MPKEVRDIKEFLEIARREDASALRVKKSKKSQQTKFKIRAKRFVYTLVLKDAARADKLTQSMPPSLAKTFIGKKNKKDKASS